MKRRLPAALATLCSLATAVGASAAEWNRDVSVGVNGYVSDNICLASNDKQTEAVGSVRPDFNITGQGARANVAVNGSFEYNTIEASDIECNSGSGNFGNRQSFVPRGSANASFVAIENLLTLQANGRATTNSVNPYGPGGDDSVNARQNQNVVYQYGAGAVLARRLKDLADVNLGYNWNTQTNQTSAYGDSTQESVNGSLTLFPAVSRVSLTASGNYSKVEYDGTLLRPSYDNELSSASVRLGVMVMSTLELNATGGNEWNDFLSVADVDGEYWDVGFAWNPNPRVSVEGGIGDRFYGDTSRFNVQYRHKRSSLTASYSETLNFPRNMRIDQGDPTDPLAPGFDALPGDPVQSSDPVIAGNSPTLNKRYSLAYSLSGVRTTFTASASESEQTRGSDLSQGTFRNINLTLTRRLSSLTSLSARVGWNESFGDDDNEFGNLGTQSELWRYSLNLSRRLGSSTNLTLGWTYITRESDRESYEYDENRVTLGVRHTF